MSDLSAILKDLKAEYLDDLTEKCSTLKELKEQKNYNELKMNYHKLKGSGTMYGIPEISILAAVMEQLYDHPSTELDQKQDLALELLEKIQVSRKDEKEYPIEQDSAFQSLKELVS